MFVVALEQPPTAIEPIAAALGITAYEARIKVAAGVPAVLLVTPDRPRAVELLASLRAQGMVASACDASTVVSIDAMTVMRDFRFEPHAITVQGTDGQTSDELPWTDLLCLLRATERSGERTTRVEKETNFSPTRILVTGGAMMTKTTKREVIVNTESRETLLLLYRRGGGRPFVLRESSAHYTALGAARGATTMQNFATTIRLIRERVPSAPLDERLVSRKPRDDDGGLALLAHLVAMSVARSNPYR